MNRLFRPSDQYENEQYQQVKNNVFSEFPSGIYTKMDDIISICNIIYDTHETILKESIKKIDTLSLIIFAIEQYEEYAKENSKYYNRQLSENDEKQWLEYPSYSRRGIKYLIEYLCQFYTTITHMDKKNDEAENDEILSHIFISIEEMCSTYIRIDSYKYMYEHVDLILNENEHTYFSVLQDLDPKNKLDIRDEKKEILHFIRGTPYGHNIREHSQVLKSSFHQHLGISYQEIVSYLQNFIRSMDYSVNIISKESIVSYLQNTYQISIQQATNIIHGFSVRAINLQDRKLFKPKQEHRAYHRGFFEFIVDGIPVLIFSRTMALESLDILINNTCYQKLPEEWRTKEVDLQLTTLSNKAGKWFEKVLKDNIDRTEIKAIHSVKNYQSNGKIIKPPKNVGEIDFIGYIQKSNALFIIEAKNVRFNTEPKLFRDDLSKFIDDKKSYSEKFISKCQWVKENLSIVIDELKSKKIDVARVDKIYLVMVILAPSPVEDKISRFSCMNLVKFMRMMEKKDLSTLVSIDVYT